jgi:hypothetical protein
LRPEFQCPAAAAKQPVQTEIEEVGRVAPRATPIEDEDEDDRLPVRSTGGQKVPWPTHLSEQVEAVRKALEAASSPVTAAELAGRFQRANRERIAEILETLVALGKARETEEGRFQV